MTDIAMVSPIIGYVYTTHKHSLSTASTMKPITTVPAISMSHEQNMHHHLIYLAASHYITHNIPTWCNMLTCIKG